MGREKARGGGRERRQVYTLGPSNCFRSLIKLALRPLSVFLSSQPTSLLSALILRTHLHAFCTQATVLTAICMARRKVLLHAQKQKANSSHASPSKRSQLTHNVDKEQGEGLTSFFIRKFIYFTFFEKPLSLFLEEIYPKDNIIEQE